SCDRARFGRGAGRTHLGREPCERGRSPGVHVAGRADAIARRGRRRLMQAADERRYGRRGFLLLVGGGLSSLVWAGPVSRLVSPLTSAASQLVGNLVPVGGWRIYTISGTMPLFDPLSWRLEIDGLVKRPRTLNYRQLTALPKAEQVSTFHCVTGWTADNVHWGGVRFQSLFDLVQPLPSAAAVRFVSMERPYEDSLTLEQLRLPDAMLAYRLAGQGLPA